MHVVGALFHRFWVRTAQVSAKLQCLLCMLSECSSLVRSENMVPEYMIMEELHEKIMEALIKVSSTQLIRPTSFHTNY